jgi:hypothetical protein
LYASSLVPLTDRQYSAALPPSSEFKRDIASLALSRGAGQLKEGGSPAFERPRKVGQLKAPSAGQSVM